MQQEGEPPSDGLPGPNESFGHFTLLERLGRGAQGVVYLAEDSQLRRKVALKLLLGAGAQASGVRDRFRREAEITSRLEHPGICAVFEAGEAQGIPYIAMQYVRGAPLARIVEDSKSATRSDETRPPSSSASITLGRQGRLHDVLYLVERAARALHVAHEAGLIHRDIKPGNIMVTPDGDPVLLDFGLARDLSAEGMALTQSGQIVGTPAYLAPEQIRGVREGIDRRADIYALGVTLYECLTLHRPFEAAGWDELFHKILNDVPPNPRRLNPRIPPDLRTVLETAMDRDPRRRYATALAFADDLRRVRSFEPILAKPAGPVTRLRKWARRHPAAGAGIAAAVLVVFAAAGLFVRDALLRHRAVRAHLQEAEASLAKADFAGALESIARAHERDSSAARAAGSVELQARVSAAREKAERETQKGAALAAASDAVRESAAKESEHSKVRSALLALRTALAAERSALFARFAPVDVRGAFARKERELASREEEAERLIREAHEALERAARLEAAWGGATPQTEAAFADFYSRRWRESLEAGESAQAAWLRSSVERHDPQRRHEKELLGRGEIEVSVVPSDAEVHLFRYEPYETLRSGDPVPRLVPVPTTGIGRAKPGPWGEDFRPGDLCLAITSVEADSPAAAAGLRPGDLVVRLNGAPCGDGLFTTRALGEGPVIDVLDRIASRNGAAIEGWFDWARAKPTRENPGDRIGLAGKTEDIACDGEALRCMAPAALLQGEAPAEMRLDCLRGGAALKVRVAAGSRAGIACEAAAYPLIVAAENRIAAGRALEADPGSYLLHVRRDGYEDQLCSLVVPRNGAARPRVELLAAASTPRGFVYVPAGPFVAAGDERAFDPRPAVEKELPGFFIAEKELTNGEWFEFVNDEATLAAIRASARPIYIPREPSQLLVESRPAGRFAWKRGTVETPVYGVSWNDVRAYLEWRNRRVEAAGESWVYDLPTQDEWEKAARGADGRPFPWGSRFDFALVVSLYRKGDWLLEAPGGFEPRDRSPYGVLDMAGSRREFTRDPVEGMSPPAYYTRGSFWGQGSEIAFRAASRALANADYSGGDTGVRLVLRPRAQ